LSIRAVLATFALILPVTVAVGAGPDYGTPAGASAAPSQEITIDGRSPGRTLDGIGALSAGASSRLLIDYPEPQRSRILDYLFTPGYGAALQILKVEIGGDTNSTAGAEASHMRSRDDLDCDRGYEWWLMREAKRRNPQIQLAALVWGAPGWFEGGFWSADNIDYQIAWLDCARRHGLTIDYMGGWNESEDFDAGWFVAFHRALVARGYSHVKLAAADGWGPDVQSRWRVADTMRADPEFAAAVDVVSVHYPCGSQGDGAPYDHCPSTEVAQSLGKPLWSGEQGSQQYDIGAGPLAKAINRSYIDGRMTSTINWSLIASWYTSIAYAGAGLMRAYQPWSGYYEASKSLWSVAHTTQFTGTGWRYLDGASGYLDGGGSFTTLRAPRRGDYSTVVETVDATAPQTVRLSVRGGLSAGRVHVWETDLGSDRPADWFRHTADVVPAGGSYQVTLRPGRLYTLTTTTGQGKGSAAAPAAADTTQQMPYADSFDTTPTGGSPRLLSDFNGRFEAAPCQNGRPGRCLTQRVTTPPIEWRYVTRTPPLTVGGDPNWWGDYAVSVDAYLDAAPYVDLIGRADAVLLGGGGQPGYRLRLSADGTWRLLEQAPDRTERMLAGGQVAGFTAKRWYRVGLSFRGDRIAATVDGRQVAAVTDDRHNRGQVALLVGDWATAQFDNLLVTRTAAPPLLLPQHRMRATSSAAQLGYDAGNTLDANPSSLWHTPWSSPVALPQSVTLDLGAPMRPQALLYTPRYDGNPNGNATAYAVYTSLDGTSFARVATGAWPATSATKSVSIPAHIGPVRYLRLEVLQGNGYAAAAELSVALTHRL
jgi:O-glycosyl hydrolase